jgi:hypothetical protein
MAKQQPLTKEQKDARDEARRSDLAQKLIDAVQAIQSSDDFIRMLEWQARLYRYSARNILLILMQRPDCTQAQSYTTWARLGRQVKKGAKGIMIYAPRIKKAERDGDEPSVFFGIEHVFAFEDTDGPELAELEYPDLDGPGNQAAYDRLLAYAGACGLTVTDTPDHPTEAKGYYSAKRKIIYIEPANPAQMLRVLAHELAHHGDRENTVSREEKETIAEGAHRQGYDPGCRGTRRGRARGRRHAHGRVSTEASMGGTNHPPMSVHENCMRQGQMDAILLD